MGNTNRRRGPLFSERLREIVRNCGKTVYQLSVEADVHPSLLGRFMSGARNSLSIPTLDKLLAALGVRLVAPRPGAKAGPGTGTNAPQTPAAMNAPGPIRPYRFFGTPG